MTGQAQTGQLRDIEVGVKGRGDREFLPLYQAGRWTDTTQARSKLDKEATAIAMTVFRNGAPAGHQSTAAADAGHHYFLIDLGYCGVYSVTYGYKTRGDQTHAALRSCGKVSDHLFAGTTQLLAHH